MRREAHKPTDEEFRSFDARSLNRGRLPYGDDNATAANQFKRGASFYRRLISKRTRFTGATRVLDLLCGFGMWSLFLAEENAEVHGIDQDRRAIKYGKAMAKHFGADNVILRQGDIRLLEKVPDGHFDLVWFYSGLQYVSRELALTQVHRILAPGGRLFVGNYTSTGLMLDHLMAGVEGGAINAGASQWALNALVRGPDADGQPNYADVETCPALCERFGFELIVASAQGGLHLGLPGGKRPDFEPPLRFGRHTVAIEFIAEKPA